MIPPSALPTTLCPRPAARGHAQAELEEARAAAERAVTSGNSSALKEQLRVLNDQLRREQVERERLEARAADLARAAARAQAAAQTVDAPAPSVQVVEKVVERVVERPVGPSAAEQEAQRKQFEALQQQLQEAQAAAQASAAQQAALEQRLAAAREAAAVAGEGEEESSPLGFVGALGIVVGGGLAGYVAVLNQSKEVRVCVWGGVQGCLEKRYRMR